ncbi:MAG: MBL fold metallo-hydrolase [Actinobacteria bacterium]|nr:MBL fold metallo-hydrolase [Actinomycetota bacterium]MBU1492859.1 MBL fold metallo-hydrolase [Actinomycetota bacterium]MBU1866600.1 MBL fold metallo-hydrolase [Actinomycetota bacterium]
MTTIRFLGGTDTVTGSKFLVEGGRGPVLVDCGMFQGPREVRDLNWDDPFFTEAPLPDEVLITHAHMDHTGWLPRLVGTHGFDGPIRCTSATADLLGIMLPDSARLQQEEAAYANKKGYSRHRPALPLYTEADVERTLALIQPAGYHEWVETAGGRARFSFAGHILGSAHIALESEGRRMVFSGDVGRWDIPVLKDPEPPPGADLLLIESTYGGRHHKEDTDPDTGIAEAVNRVAGRDGVLVIPAFSIGRTQEILFRIRALEDAGRIPELPVFLDSPMAIDATEQYARHHEEHDLEIKALEAEGTNPLRPARLQFSHTVEESKAINRRREAMVVISASGMATGGRVPHHLKRRLPYPENMVAFVGYQAEGTLGRLLVDGADRVRIHGEEIEVVADVVRLEALSAHADQDELIRWVGEAVPERIALIHGEDEGRAALAEAFRVRFDAEILLPVRGDVLEV